MRMTAMQRRRWEAFQKERGYEIFCAGSYTYDVTLAYFLVAQDERDAEEVSVQELAVACGFDHPPVKEEDDDLIFVCADSTRLAINKDHFQTELNLDDPLMRNEYGDLIDGHHRLYRAFLLGRETLAAYQLTADEAEACTAYQ